MLRVFLYNNCLTNSDLEERIPHLPRVLQQRLAKRKRLDSRLHSLAGYLLLQQALQEYGQSIEQLQFSKNGKPFIADSSLAFSISHNAGLVGLCLAQQGNIGFDIQAQRYFEPIESAFSFFSPQEQVAILNSSTPDQTLIQYWSKKEALIKAGSGRMFDEAALTNATRDRCYWKGTQYHWYTIPTDFEGAIWIAVDSAVEKIIVKKCPALWTFIIKHLQKCSCYHLRKSKITVSCPQQVHTDINKFNNGWSRRNKKEKARSS